ncbi:amino acid ABC transporter permease (plasmid) [Agrobacterium leguminum]|uniref:ABC transporter, membrane spanning protein (Amino acid) n=1 Tax=Agrobacterium deltaense NCPPB 1641 TaxID=1183425 RepID=A0A1S7UB84_9HYPH|nr:MULTISPECIES: amino acid ABC transporter permease [Agrobacterium]WFS69761.1 amino acid ABC transporter permease [Agrobacterium leguminum]CVI64072.1 ABC transporter, membrane spanning protein (Amino acid) [Agrobacterium deltaense NCPPB 1641]
MYILDFAVVLERWPELLVGCLATLGLACAGMALALVIGLGGVGLRQSHNMIAHAVVSTFVEVIRNTPFLVQIFFLFFALPYFGLVMSPTMTAVIALGINGGAYAIEIIRGGVESIPQGQSEAGLALGLNRRQIFRFIILKPAVRAIYPALTSQFILLTLTSAVCSSISAYELTSVGQAIDSDTFRSFEIYLTITMLYLLISWLLMSLFVVISRQAFSYPTK